MSIDEDMLYKHIGQLIKAHRMTTGITQDQLAVRVGVNRTSITNIETGLQKLPLHLLYRICEVLNVEAATMVPSLSDVALGEDMKTVEVDGNTKQMSPRTANFVQGIWEDLSDDKK